jgi:hypothetical protein
MTNYMKTWFFGRWEVYFHWYLNSWKIGFAIHTSLGIGLDLQVGPITVSVFTWTNKGAEKLNETLNSIGE